jgi:Family of unknown function (DUF6065)
MKLLCYALEDFAPKLVAAHPQRGWMDHFPERHAYRCLPLTIANAHGWEALCPAPIEINWNGGREAKDISIRALKRLPGGWPVDRFCCSHFTSGIVTFYLHYIFRTDPGWDLLATGSFNRWKDNASPLTGVIESDWLPYPFTMNWQILRPGRVIFEEDEPFCFFFPVKTRALVDCELEIHNLSDNDELSQRHAEFRLSREEYMRQLGVDDNDSRKGGNWQRHYFLGRHPDGTKVDEHLGRIRLKNPVDRRSRPAQRPIDRRL